MGIRMNRKREADHEYGPCGLIRLDAGAASGVVRPSLRGARARPRVLTALRDFLQGHRDEGDYRTGQSTEGSGLRYDANFRSGYLATLWTEIERPLIDGILRDLGGPDRTCLDFACGTGRITKVAASHFGIVIGVDVSADMLSQAATPGNVVLLPIDITTNHGIDGTFDVVTAFRFFLNAESSLRLDALTAIHRHLNEGGTLICNVQTNASSPIGLVYRMFNWLLSRPVRHTLGLEAVKGLLTSSGFEIVDVRNYGFLPRPGPLLPRLCARLVTPCERACRFLHLPGRLAGHFLVVAKKRDVQWQS